MTTINTTPIAEIKTIVDLLDGLDINALHLRADAKPVGDTRPDVSIWITYRTEFERVCEALGAKPKERRYSRPGQREWYAELDTPARRLLIQCASFEHHHDWQPRNREDAA